MIVTRGMFESVSNISELPYCCWLSCFHQHSMKNDDIRLFKWQSFTHPFPQVVGQQQISCKVVSKGSVKPENFLQCIAFDDVQVTVSQSSNVSTGLSQGHLLPEHVTKNITFTWKKESNPLTGDQRRHVKTINVKTNFYSFDCVVVLWLLLRSITTQLLFTPQPDD